MIRRNFRTLSFILFLLILGAVIYGYTRNHQPSAKEIYKTRLVDRGDVIQVISANGTLTPLELVNVGTQVSGTVAKIYVDFNDQVKKGQILAELDQALLRAQLLQSEANYQSAQATLNITQNKALRGRTLLQKGFISKEALDDLEQQLVLAKAQVAISKATVERDRANLNYSVIRSPISGVVVARDINVGQTVAANFQTPILFQIAKDLYQMQINISVAEADIGQIQTTQEITFNVDAFQEREFTASVKQIRLNPTIQENVVTYNVVAAVENRDGILLPGMTANVRFVINHKRDVLRISNAALRYKPSRDEAQISGVNQAPQGTQLYRLKNQAQQPVQVTTGVTDGHMTEIVSGDLNVGDEIIVSDSKSSKSKGSSASNFRFRMF